MRNSTFTAIVAGAFGICNGDRDSKRALRSRALRFAIFESTFRRYGRAPATPRLRGWSTIFSRLNSLMRLRAALAPTVPWSRCG